jgi:serine/threonine protein kinase
MRLLQYNPQSRPSAASVLEHPWLRMHPSQYRTLPLTDAMKEFRVSPLLGKEYDMGPQAQVKLSVRAARSVPHSRQP